MIFTYKKPDHKKYLARQRLKEWFETSQEYMTCKIYTLHHKGYPYTYIYRQGDMVCFSRYRGWSPWINMTLEEALTLDIRIK